MQTREDGVVPEIIAASNKFGWELALLIDANGVHVGTRNKNYADHQDATGLYLSPEQIDKLIIKLLKAKQAHLKLL